MKGSQESLTTVVVKDAANWATPAARDTQGQRGAAANARKGNPLDTLPNQMAVYGLPDPANLSTDASRPELWPTARGLDGQLSESLDTWEARRARKEAQGINLHRPLPIAVEQEQRRKLDQQVKNWATPRAEMDSGAHNGIPDTLHSQMKVQAVGKLNPRWVETLMGLPVGWTMPSCASPVTIERMN